jgi:hypothetical protein
MEYQVSCAWLQTLTTRMEASAVTLGPTPGMRGNVVDTPITNPEIPEDGDHVRSPLSQVPLRIVTDAVLAFRARDSHQPRPWGHIADNLSRWSTRGRERLGGHSYNPPGASESAGAILGRRCDP